MKQIQNNTHLFTRFLALFCFLHFYSCGVQNEAEESNSEETQNLSEPVSETEEKVDTTLIQDGNSETLAALISVFNSSSDDIPDTLIDNLGLSSSDYWADQYLKMVENHLFISWMPGGATSEYQYSDYNFSYVDELGNHIGSIGFYATNDWNFEIIHKENLLITNNFVNYDFSGDVAEETGDSTRIIKGYFFAKDDIIEFNKAPKEDLAFYRNRIYARHGLIFKTQKYTDYFSEFEWYKPTSENVDDKLSADEKKLAEFIKSLEK